MDKEEEKPDVIRVSAMEDFNNAVRGLIIDLKERSGFTVTSITITTIEHYDGEFSAFSVSSEAKKGKFTIKG